MEYCGFPYLCGPDAEYCGLQRMVEADNVCAGTGVEVFTVMEKMNKPIPHRLSFLRPVSTVSVAAILIYEPLPCVVSTPLLCMVKCCLLRNGMKGVRGHEPPR